MSDDVVIGGCEAHADLVARAMGAHATDVDLERYAEEVVGCPACRRLLAVEAGVHPAHLERVADGEHAAVDARLAMDDAAVERLRDALTPRPRWVAGLALAAAAALVIWLAGTGPEPTTVAPVVPAELELVQTGPVYVPRRVESLPQALPGAVVAIEPETSVDWPPPPFEELRRQVTKQVAVREARLELVGEPAIGSSVRLAVSAAASEAVTICVAGVENGVIWRGGLPGGRTVLIRSSRAVRYAFPRAGQYRFGLSLGDGCARPVHTVEVVL